MCLRIKVLEISTFFLMIFFQIEEGIVVMEDDSPVEAVSTPNTPRNLAAWKISIPYVDFFEDSSSERKEKKERIPVFCIDVERNDRRAGRKFYESLSWKILIRLCLSGILLFLIIRYSCISKRQWSTTENWMKA